MAHAEHIIFAALLTIAIVVFLYSCTRLVRIILMGQEDGRLKGTILKRFWSMIEYAFLQRRVISTGYGWNHLLIFWGFLVLLLANVEFVFAGLFPELTYRELLPFWWIEYVYAAFDVTSLAVLLSIMLAVGRRVILRPAHIEALSRDAFIILGLIAGLMVAFFGMQ
jgi:hypothetical protein